MAANNNDFFEALELLAKEKGVSKENLVEKIKAAIVHAVRRDYGGSDNIHVDIAGSIVGLIITAFVSVVLVPLIKLDSPGPIIFTQDRIGMNGRVFKLYKFRSMYKDAEERKKELMDKNEMSGLMFKMENDPRITKVGKFIRNTSLDELPQFWNVLKGDMSLVGTRPPTVDEYMQYNAYQKRRISFKPGITGLWQVSGRSDIKDFDEIVRLDLEYIDNWSIWLDVKLIFKTILVVFRRKGAQ